ncbi:PREDICTED: mesothelin-like protein-like [Chrysochloris asiatica]|uniref:Mesothelin-like protein-like n=1 Tax=Chrysochloris asiatica TaxID=185453 RepID=A0A9B0U1C6_CHRAS|nr:PREDICTED: mesothelin-like protein-like [Chrysochloris asiatica]
MLGCTLHQPQVPAVVSKVLAIMGIEQGFREEGREVLQTETQPTLGYTCKQHTLEAPTIQSEVSQPPRLLSSLGSPTPGPRVWDGWVNASRELSCWLPWGREQVPAPQLVQKDVFPRWDSLSQDHPNRPSSHGPLGRTVVLPLGGAGVFQPPTCQTLNLFVTKAPWNVGQISQILQGDLVRHGEPPLTQAASMGPCLQTLAGGLLQGVVDTDRLGQWDSDNSALLRDFWCQPASQLSRDQLSALVRRMAAQKVVLEAWQLSCLANLVEQRGLQDDFELHPPNLLLFYNLTQVTADDCQAFTRHAGQGDTELLANLPDQRVALQRMALDCLGSPGPQLSASHLLLLGGLVCDMDAASIVTADPQVLQNLQNCSRLTTTQQDALNMLLASGRTKLGSPDSWNLEGLQALGPLAIHISPRLWTRVPEAVGLDFFRSSVTAFREGRLGPRDARRFVTGFLKAKVASPRSRRGTGRACLQGDITATTLRDGLFLVRYDCPQLESCLDTRVLRANLDPLLQQPLPAECQRVVKAKLSQIYPHGIPEDQLKRITSLVYLYSSTEIKQWNITSLSTVLALLAADVALDNQTEAVLQKYLDHNGTLTGPLLIAIGGSRLCWMSPRQIQTIRPSEFRLAGAPDISACPQSRKNVLYAKAQEAFRDTMPAIKYYHLMRPYLGGATVEELQHLAQGNVSLDIDTFTNLNPRVMLNLSADNVMTLLGQNVGDLQKVRSLPIVSRWLDGLSRSALHQLGLDNNAVSSSDSAFMTQETLNIKPRPPHPAYPSDQPMNDAETPTSGIPRAHLASLPLVLLLPSSLLWLLHQMPLCPPRPAH